MLPTKKLDQKSLSAKTIVATMQTDAGCVREANEDDGRHFRPNDRDVQLRRGTLTIVADGMGGHASGEIASRMAIELVGELYYSDYDEDAPAAALKKAIETANRLIYEAATRDDKLAGMGTTLIALVLQNNTAFVAHVGDSRLYRLRGQDFELLTVDHSQVMLLVKYGIISYEDARNHEHKNVIFRALGTQPEVEVEMSEPFPVAANDVFLLCSDGLCDMVEDEEMREILLAAADVHAAGEQLIALAKKRGGHDNITVGIVRVLPESAAETAKPARVTREVEALKQ